MGSEMCIRDSPSLTPITTDTEWVRALKGVTLEDVGLVITDANNKRLDQRRGGFLFTHFGLSGPVALDISRTITGHVQPRELTLHCDFLPERSQQDFSTRLKSDCQSSGKKQLASILAQIIPRRLADAILEQTEIDPQSRGAELSKKLQGKLVTAIKANQLAISGTRGFKKAEVTAGGVSLEEIDSRTMESRMCPNLFVAGELLDLDGPIGGYNFQAAFSTAWLAGQSV